MCVSCAQLGDSCFFVQCFGQELHTETIEDATSAVFDETIFLKAEKVTPDELNSLSVRIQAYDMNTFARHSMIGQNSIGLAHLYHVENRRMLKRWFALGDPKRSDEGVQGYALVSLQICGPSDTQLPMDEPLPPGAESMVVRPPSIKAVQKYLVVSI